MQVVRTGAFVKAMKKMCSRTEEEKIRRFVLRLEQQTVLGDAIGPSWFREFRLNGKRVYFIVSKNAVGLVALSHKHDQQQVINEIRAHLLELKDQIQKLTNS